MNVRIPDGYQDIDTWPNVNEELIKEESEKNAFIKKRSAVKSYLTSGNKLIDISINFGIPSSEIIRLSKRCMEPHPDGLIWGFRALLKYKRIIQFERIAQNKDVINNNGGDAGAFSKLLNEYPAIKILIHDRVLRKKYGKVTIGKFSMKKLHEDMINMLSQLGVKSYPVNRATQGFRSLAEYVKKLKANNPMSAAEGFSKKDVAVVIQNSGIGETKKPVSRSFQRIELDEHCIDLMLTLCVPLPFGGYKYVPLSRIWVIVAEDTKNRSVLGYHLVLKEKYNHLDVMRAIYRSFESQPRIAKVIPELNNIKGGLPVDLFPELRWVAWDEVALDRHMTHRAKKVKSVLRKKIGCTPVMDKAYTPMRRPYIESFFRKLEEKLHQLPNTTGSYPNDPSRKNPEIQANKYGITAEEINEFLDACIAEYMVDNDNQSLGYRSPIEALVSDMNYQRNYGLPFRKVPPNNQNKIAMLGDTYVVPIVNSNDSRRPYINFLHVRYRNDIIASNKELVGAKIIIAVDPDDLRYVLAYLESGEELGFLQAEGDWGHIPHTIETRKDFFKKENKQLRGKVNKENSLSTYLLAICERAKKSRQDASRWAHAMKTISSTLTDIEIDDLDKKQAGNKRVQYSNKSNYKIPKRYSTKILIED